MKPELLKQLCKTHSPDAVHDALNIHVHGVAMGLTKIIPNEVRNELIEIVKARPNYKFKDVISKLESMKHFY